MGRTFTAAAPYVTTLLILTIGLSVDGCSDSASVNPVVELASLTVRPGTLQPSFSGATTEYTVDLANNIPGVTVTAQPAVAGDSVTIDGEATTSRSIPLGAAGETDSCEYRRVGIRHPISNLYRSAQESSLFRKQFVTRT